MGMNIVNVAGGRCLEIFAPCKDGSDGALNKDCERMDPKDIPEGTNVQLFRCHSDKNQHFEYTSEGRLRNPTTAMCLDIKAPCNDGSDAPGCKRQKVNHLRGEHNKANIQLWHCHEDEGERSASYGNQLWNFGEGGGLINAGSGLCMQSVGLVDESNIEVAPCSGEDSQVFTFKTGAQAAEIQPKDMKEGAEAETSAKFQVLLPEGMLEALGPRLAYGRSHVKLSVAAAGTCGLMLAAILRARPWRRGVEARRTPGPGACQE